MISSPWAKRVLPRETIYGPCFFPPDAADLADIQQAGNAIASEATREDNRIEQTTWIKKPFVALFLEIFKQRHLRN